MADVLCSPKLRPSIVRYADQISPHPTGAFFVGNRLRIGESNVKITRLVPTLCAIVTSDDTTTPDVGEQWSIVSVDQDAVEHASPRIRPDAVVPSDAKLMPKSVMLTPVVPAELTGSEPVMIGGS